jgi:hypothetical protein
MRKPCRRQQLQRVKRRKEDNIILDLRERGCKDRLEIELDHNHAKWHAMVLGSTTRQTDRQTVNLFCMSVTHL